LKNYYNSIKTKNQNMIKLNNKKGQNAMGEEAGKAVIGVLCIIVLIAAGVLVYNLLFSGNPDKDQAESNIKDMAATINVLQAGEKQEMLLVNPNGWAITHYIQNSVQIDPLPNSCQKHACYCICLDGADSQKLFENCNNPATGVCEIYDDSFAIPAGKILISGATKITISNENNRVYIR